MDNMLQMSIDKFNEDEKIEDNIRSMRIAFGVGSDYELARYLGIDPSTISAWKRRKSIPQKYYLMLGSKTEQFVRAKITGYPDLFLLRGSYIFAIIAVAAKTLDKTILSHVEGMTVRWAGFRLHRLHSYVEARLGLIPNMERERLFEEYEALMRQAESDDLYLWLESLPEPKE